VIYIIKENRTYDQVLGDLVDAKGIPIGDHDRSMVQWGQAITPNQHNLARSTTFMPRQKSITTDGCGALRRNATNAALAPYTNPGSCCRSTNQAERRKAAVRSDARLDW
jgi:hypothetical protein